MSLKNLRDKVDAIDKKIVDLLNQRARVVKKIGELKKEKNLAVFSPEREALILRQLQKYNQGPLSKEDIELIFTNILSVYRAFQILLKIVYLGPEGTFTHSAALKKFGSRAEYLPAQNIQEVFERVERDNISYGVIPIENSIEGAVTHTLDMFLISNLKICSEIAINVFHSLLRLPKANKRLLRIYSHPQVFAQCRNWLNRQYPKAELISVASTALAAAECKKDPYSACIGNSILAGVYGLKEIERHLEDSPNNVTRFLVISSEDSKPTGNDKTSVLFSVSDKVGALYEILSVFRKRNINLTKIESRPSKRKAWEYYFFVDFCGHRTEKKVSLVLEELKTKCAFLKILGSYPKQC